MNKRVIMKMEERNKVKKAKLEYQAKQSQQKEDPNEIAAFQLGVLANRKVVEKDVDFSLDLENENQKPLSLAQQLAIIDSLDLKPKAVKVNSETQPLAKNKQHFLYCELVGCKKYEMEEKVGRVTVGNELGEVVYDAYIQLEDVTNFRSIHVPTYERSKKVSLEDVLAQLKKYPKISGCGNPLKIKGLIDLSKKSLSFEKMSKIYLSLDVSKHTTITEKLKILINLSKIH